MAKINIEKFICSLIERSSGINQQIFHSDLISAIKDQGLEYKGGEIVKTQRRVAAEAKEAIFDNEDERIRKRLLTDFSILGKEEWGGLKVKDICTWLEKQKEKHISSTPIWKHWKDGIAGNGDGTPIYLVKTGITYSITSCLGFECDYIELSELDKLLSEKQGEQKPVESSRDYNDIDPHFGIPVEDLMSKEKPTWSEEDAKMFNYCCEYLNVEQCTWLKSLKERLKGE